MSTIINQSKLAVFGLAALLALAVGVSGLFATSAYAIDDTALQPASTKASITKKTTKTLIWVKEGKEWYSWGNYEKNIKNGTLKPRETMTSYVETAYTTDGSSVTLSKLKSSNKKVIKPKYSKKYGYLTYSAKKAGKAKVTYTLKYTNKKGKKVTEKVTEKHIVVRYANPLQSFKVGSTEIVSKFDESSQYNAKKGFSGEITVKAAPGWKAVKMRQVNSAIVSGEWVPQKRLPNGSEVKIKKSDKKAIEVICYNKAGKYYESVILAPNFKYGVVYG